MYWRGVEDKIKLPHLLRTVTNALLMYVTGYYTTVSMAIIWKHHLPPVISVSRKRCIPSSSTSKSTAWWEVGGIKVTQLDHVESKAEQHTRVSSLSGRMGGSPFIEMTHLGWNRSDFSHPWRRNNQFLPLHTTALTESTPEGFNGMFSCLFPLGWYARMDEQLTQGAVPYKMHLQSEGPEGILK